MPQVSNLARINVADRLAVMAAQMPEAIAVATPGGRELAGNHAYATCTFRQLDADATALARGLVGIGVRPGARLVMLVPPGIEFVKLVFALLRNGATTVLVDPGMGRKHLVDCLAAAEPEGFVAVSRAHAVRALLRRRFPQAAMNITVGRRWFWGGLTYRQLLKRGRDSAIELPATLGDDPAAIIFTSGSTGPPKGVLYTHRMFETQVAEIQRMYDLQPGGADLACFALFGLFNSAMGVTTVFPDMDFSRPASAEPRKLLAAANDWRVTQAFASPAVWDKLSCYCEATADRIPTLRRAFSCGAPVPAAVLRRTLQCVASPGTQMHTPYGATEALPVSTIEAREVLGETAAATSKGAGVCVGRRFDAIEWRVIGIKDEPIATIDDTEVLPTGEIGELIVRGPQVSPQYLLAPSPLRGGCTEHGRPEVARAQVIPWAKPSGRGADASTRPHHPSLTLPIAGRGQERSFSANALAKIPDRPSSWHRMGDVGYLDHHGRFWYCGRKSHRVETPSGPLYTERVEAVFNQHPAVRRCALVELGNSQTRTPVILIESDLRELRDCRQGMLSKRGVQTWNQLAAELKDLAAASPLEQPIDKFLLIPELPVDIRHNSKINREAAAAWAIDIIKDFGLWTEYGL